jgi:serine protease Do
MKHFIGLMAAAGVAGALFLSADNTAAQPQPQRVTPTSVGQMQLSFAGVVRRASPAVVNIYSKRKVRNPYADDPLLGRFFRDRVQSSLGSGVIVRADGIVVTNNHVVADADQITVVLADRREFEARLLLADERTDLAVLRLNTGGKSLPTLNFHDSDDAQVGDIVLAIGNPFGVGQTVTSGIVSALARTQVGISDYQFFIQTDAAINPGNSGGALVTMGGELIGINTAIFSRSGGSIGIGFAIPANMVKTVVNSAIGGAREVARPWLGVETQPVDAALAESLGLDRPTGVLITKVDDVEVNDEPALNFRIATKGIGNNATLTFIRNGQARTTSVRLVREPANAPQAAVEIDGKNPLQGAVVSNITSSMANELGVEPGSGVLITEMSRRSIAAQYGFAPGDVIVSVNGKKTNSVTSLKAALKGANAWRITAVGPNGSKTLTIR